MWAVLSALHPVDRKYHPDRVSKYEKYKNELKFDDIEFPVIKDKIPKFEKLNNINISLFSYNDNFKINPLHISQNKYDKDIDLLMYNQGDNYHYCWIKNFDRLVSKQYNKDNNKYYHCKRCLHGIKTKKTLEQHDENCITEPTRIKMPSENR